MTSYFIRNEQTIIFFGDLKPTTILDFCLGFPEASFSKKSFFW